MSSDHHSPNGHAMQLGDGQLEMHERMDETLSGEPMMRRTCLSGVTSTLVLGLKQISHRFDAASATFRCV